MKQLARGIGIRHWIILGAISIFSSLGLLAPPARAETKQIDFTLSSDSAQTFEVLIEQAKSTAQRLIEQGFAESPSITEISVTILAERNGQQVPLLFSNVSRSEWQSQPKVQEWTKYSGGSSMVLLGFMKPPVQQTAFLPTPNLPPSSVSNSAKPPGLNGASLEESDTGFR